MRRRSAQSAGRSARARRDEAATFRWCISSPMRSACAMSGRRGMPPLRRSARPSNGPASSRSQARRSSTAASWAPKRRTRPRPSLIATCARFWNARFSTTKTGIDRVRSPVIGPTARWRWQGSKRTSPAAPSSAAASSVDAQPSYRSAPTMAPRSGGHIAAHAIGGPAWRTRRSPRPSAVAAGTQSTRTGSAATRRASVSRFAAAMPGGGELTGGMIPPGRLASQSRNPRGRGGRSGGGHVTRGAGPRLLAASRRPGVAFE